MACGPRKAAVARVRAGLLELESRSDWRKEKPPDGRASRRRERRGGRGGADWSVERENGLPGWARRGKERAGEKVLGRGERRKRREEGGGLGQKR